jgi:hypothetical protein
MRGRHHHTRVFSTPGASALTSQAPEKVLAEKVFFFHDGNMSEGVVVGYAADMEMGVITTQDGKRYFFARPDWLSLDVSPAAGLVVTFEAAGPAAVKIKAAGRASQS